MQVTAIKAPTQPHDHLHKHSQRRIMKLDLKAASDKTPVPTMTLAELAKELFLLPVLVLVSMMMQQVEQAQMLNKP
jgi:hypothetical protein